MNERELLEHYKRQSERAQYYIKRYIDELKLHFLLEDEHIIKIFEEEIKFLKKKNPQKHWFHFFRRK